MAVALAGAPRSHQVAPSLFRMSLHVVRRIAAHEGELQRPAGLTDDRKPDQTVLQKKANECRAVVKNARDYEDVHPGNVVADDQITSLAADVVDDSGDIPFRRQHQVEDSIRSRHPSLTKRAQSE